MDDPSSRLEEALRLALGPLPAEIVALWAGLCLLASPFVLRRPSRLRRALRIGVSAAAVGAAVIVVLSEAHKEGAEYYKHVDEVVAQSSALQGKNLLVLGCIVDGSIERSVDNPLRVRFVMRTLMTEDTRPYATIKVAYEGLVPDTFETGREAVVRGQLTDDGRIEVVPDGVMVRCPSKYDSRTTPKRSCPY